MEEFVITDKGKSVLMSQGSRFDELGYSDSCDNIVLAGLFYDGSKSSEEFIGHNISGYGDFACDLGESNVESIFSRLKRNGLIVNTGSYDIDKVLKGASNYKGRISQWVKNRIH